MGKTIKKKSYSKEMLMEKQLINLKEKYENRKNQVRRLKSYIRELEKKLEAVGKPIDESKVDKPKKLSPEEKAIFEREDLKKRLKERFCGAKNG